MWERLDSLLRLDSWELWRRRSSGGVRDAAGSIGHDVSPGTPAEILAAARASVRAIPRWIYVLIPLFILIILLAGAAISEMRTSEYQARLFSRIASDISYSMGTGPSAQTWYPPSGPYNERLGYVQIPNALDILTQRGFAIAAQARISPGFQKVVNRGLFPIYREKTQAGLSILDRDGNAMYQLQTPERVFESYEAISSPIVDALLFIENRTLLDSSQPHKNPAVEWNRFGKAILDKGLALLGSDRSVPGASTLATQLEKVRHSDGGLTDTPGEKIQQMLSASLRSYKDGRETLEARKRVVTDYINSVPLAGLPPYGEIIGLADGLWAWFGADHEDVNEILGRETEEISQEELEEKALAYRQVLSLFLAHRRPSYYLGQESGREALKALTDTYLRLMAAHGNISEQLRDAALEAEIEIRENAPARAFDRQVDRKAVTRIRTDLLSLTATSRMYDLDRYDLTVKTTYDSQAQQEVTELLQNLQDPSFLAQQGMRWMLGRGHPSQVKYAIVLYERTPIGNAVRVQTDNFDGPFDINHGSKLELGSTAKLRTIVTYLEIIEEQFQEYSGRSSEELRSVAVPESDRLTSWLVDHLVSAPNADLSQVLEAAMNRRYSANPHEEFFTGGYGHTFQNLTSSFDYASPTMRTAFRYSVNLPFIRLMRDIVQYHIHRLPDNPIGVLTNPNDPRRDVYLIRSAERELERHLHLFYIKFNGLDREEMLERLVDGRNLSVPRLAAMFRTVAPRAPLEEFSQFVRRFSRIGVSDQRMESLYETNYPAGKSWADAGIETLTHPMELWLVSHFLRNPDASRGDVSSAIGTIRKDVTEWLLRSDDEIQNSRLHMLLEEDAFVEIHKRWRKAGYPFGSLVPSYATAIGSSADRPGALAELIGIVVNDGIRYPLSNLLELHFAEGTPYEAIVRRAPEQASRVISPEVAATVRSALVDVVERGTADRARRAIRDENGRALTIGGKTGTGDNRLQIFDRQGNLVESRSISRTSVLSFFIGDRFYGTLTAYVQGEEAADYRFTSSLPSQILRLLDPALRPLFERESHTAL